MKTLFSIIILLASFKGLCGDGFPPLVQVTPNNISTNTEVQVGVTISLCTIPTVDFYFEIENNNIRLVFASTRFSPCPPGFYVLNYNIGTLPEGQYTVTVYETPGVEPPTNITDPNLILIQYGEPVSFGVSAPRIVPSLNMLGVISMLFVFLLFAFFIFEKRVSH